MFSSGGLQLIDKLDIQEPKTLKFHCFNWFGVVFDFSF